MKSRYQIIQNLSIYGIAHAVVDTVCIAIVLSLFTKESSKLIDIINIVVLYNVLAFGLQVIFGLIVDYLKKPKFSSMLGITFTILSVFFASVSPILAVICAGIGNALFHVGGGSISLNLIPGKATAPGIYVAPGAIGVLVGTLLGKSNQIFPWIFVLILVLLLICIWFIKEPEIDYNKQNDIGVKYVEIILLLMLISIAVRSFVGSIIVFPWKSDILLLVILTISIVLGKGLGGIIADRYGWLRIGVISLLLSIPFLILGPNIPILGIIGIFLFNITMPITLIVMSNSLPGRPGFAFGLTCLALIFGALPTFTNLGNALGNSWIIISMITISALSIYYGLVLSKSKV